MEMPKFLIDIFDRKIEASISHEHNGSYSIGLLLSFKKRPPNGYLKRIYIKLIPICDLDDDQYLYLRYNMNQYVYTSKRKWFDNEVRIQQELYEKTLDYPICLKLFNSFIIDNIFLILFFKKLIKHEKKQSLNMEILESSIFGFKGTISMGVIVMEYLDSSMAFKLFSPCYTMSKSFGKHFNENPLIDCINRNKNHILMFYLTQIISAMNIMFKLGYIHNDLHFGNILIKEDEICSSFAYDQNIKRHYIGRIYIIDFGNAYNVEQTQRYLLKTQNKNVESCDFIDIVNILGRKSITDGYNFDEKRFNDKWYIYDWFVNIFFNKQIITIKPEIVNKMENLVKKFNESKIQEPIYKKTEAVENKRCFCLF